jgi:hypothetical protein
MSPQVKREPARVLRAAQPYLPVVLTTAALAWATTSAVLAQTGGEPAVPLDDTFIHFQFARSIAELRPLTYTPGSAPTPGATSLLWPLVLAPLYAVGFRGDSLIWPAWAIGWVCLGLLACETRGLAHRVTSPTAGIAAGAMVLLFGGHVWFAGSGMEVIPFAWLLLRTARCAAQWGESGKRAESAAGHRRARIELCVLGVLTPLMRPEGLLATLLAAVALALFPRGKTRAWALLPLAGPALFVSVNLLLTGQPTTTTMEAKWLFSSPYRHLVWAQLTDNLAILVNTLLDGRVWSQLFLPQGGKLIAWAALPALAVVGWLRGAAWRAAVVLVVALGMALPATYDTFLVNRLRYLWPFAAAWFVALVALAEGLGMAAARLSTELRSIGLLVAGGFVGALAGHLPFAIDDLATSADAVRQQQVALGRWAREALPSDSVLGVNDAGAIAYFSDRRTFDIVGLTTIGEAKYWVAGPGSRYEHYERLGAARMPTHFIVYTSWFAIPPLLGTLLTERSVHGATILGDSTKAAYLADYSALRRAERPTSAELHPSRLLDALDVADLESEASHRYELFWATKEDNVVLSEVAGRADGARQARTLDRFMLEVGPAGTIVARLTSAEPVRVQVLVGQQPVGQWQLRANGGWEEPTLRLPASVRGERQLLQVQASDGGSFTAMHYWSYR